MTWNEPHKEGASVKVTIEDGNGAHVVLHADAVLVAAYRAGAEEPDSTALLAGEGNEQVLLELDTAAAGCLFQVMHERGVDSEHMKKLRNVATHEGIARIYFHGQPGHPGPMI